MNEVGLMNMGSTLCGAVFKFLLVPPTWSVSCWFLFEADPKKGNSPPQKTPMCQNYVGLLYAKIAFYLVPFKTTKGYRAFKQVTHRRTHRDVFPGQRLQSYWNPRQRTIRFRKDWVPILFEGLEQLFLGGVSGSTPHKTKSHGLRELFAP